MHFLTSKNIERKKELIHSRCEWDSHTEFGPRFYACHRRRRRCDLFHISLQKVGKKVELFRKGNFHFCEYYFCNAKK
jgi:hypothetical protein